VLDAAEQDDRAESVRRHSATSLNTRLGSRQWVSSRRTGEKAMHEVRAGHPHAPRMVGVIGDGRNGNACTSQLDAVAAGRFAMIGRLTRARRRC